MGSDQSQHHQQQHQQHQHQQHQHQQQQPGPFASTRSLTAVQSYQFYQHPTDANLGRWATSAAPTITGHQAAALIHHTENHAAGITAHLANQGVTTTPRQNLVQSHMTYLRNHWPNGQWYPDTCRPSTDPPSLDVLTPFKSMTQHWLAHSQGRPLFDLWAQSPQRGIIWQVVNETRSTGLTKRVAQESLRRVKRTFPAAAAPRPKPAAPAPTPDPAPVSEPEPEAPRADPLCPPLAADDEFAPPALGQSKRPSLRLTTTSLPPLDSALEFGYSRTPSPPPMPESDDDESDVSVDGVLGDLFGQPGIPLAPVSKKYKRVRELGLAAAKKKKDTAETSARRRRCAEERATAAAAEAAEIGENGLGAEKIQDIAEVLADAASKAVSRAAKRHYGHLLPPGRRAVMTKRAKQKTKEMVTDYL
ncbi:uncharacterized protein LY79DRAFT_528329 [Colletotrichum navitas]|uniref:Uncharacterized protein n=1 Tax=Colletotrichum navitas TaxID=681940 RepID=A0AAD8UXY8_9PEZI|nr:uncharacterized protein LY79DRAFT_528329 [Colletotrichum navitas]KAK1569641.1 hypothetical protein LY79DRAFT_528329 [Colletotrichum navitas]